MTTFSIIDFTLASAFCNATNAAQTSDRNCRIIDEAIEKPAKTASFLVTIRGQLEAVIRSFRMQHTETA